MISITSWAENVPPGSPAPPRRKGSYAESEECKSALKAAGYTSSIVNLQNVILPPPAPLKKSRYSLIPEPRPSSSHKEVRRTNSQSSLNGSQQRSSAPRRPTTTATSPAHAMPRSTSEHRRERSQSTIKDKKAKYAKYPAPLDRDLALAQFMDGGKPEDQVRKFVEARAKMSGAQKVNGQYVGAGDVYRDAQGGVWRDQDEELEYTHLLNEQTGEKSWVPFSKDAAALEDEYRRGSVSTMETQDSDLDPRYAMHPNDDEIAKFGGAVPPHAHTRQSARHLRKSEALLDPFPLPSDSSATPSVNSKERRRPPPLTFDPSEVSPSYVYSPGNPAYQEAGKKDFMESSFSPTPATAKPVSSRPGTSTTQADSKSKLGMKGILKAVGMKK